MSIYKRGDVYWYKFMWKGELVRVALKKQRRGGLSPKNLITTRELTRVIWGN